MEIPRKYIENYNDAINEISDRARDELEVALRGIDYSADVSAIREATVSVMERYCGASSTLSARLAAEFYDGLRAEMLSEDDGYKAEIRSAWDPDATRGGVEAIANTLVKDKRNTEAYIRQCLDRMDYETRRAANQCIFLNSRKDPRKPRYARVPAGMETCDFCIMLASRGFVYKGADLASHSHAHCDCVVVPSWDKKNPAVQGYDPKQYYRIWKKYDSIDKMGDLRYGEKKALRLCAIDSEIPITGKQRQEFADTLNTCLDRAYKAYKKDKTQARYDSDMNRLLGKIGDIYGFKLKGQYLSGKGKAGANPSGDEVWAVVQRRDLYKTVVFQGQIKGRGGDADIWADGIYIDVKTPEKLSKLGKRLNHAAEQCHAMGQAEGYAILSDLRFKGDFKEAIKVAREFVESGTLEVVYLTEKGSEISRLARLMEYNGDLSGPNIPGFDSNRASVIEIKKYLSQSYGKTKPLSFEEADGGKCNPNLGKPGFSRNCQTTAAVYELRRRGFNVEALPRTEGNTVMDALAQNPLAIWKDPVSGKPLHGKDLMGYTPRQAIAFLEENIRQGERYTLAFNRIGKGGHVVSVERDDFGKLFVFDSQNHEIYKLDRLEDFFTDTNRIEALARVDNAILDYEKAAEIVRVSFNGSTV